MCECVCVHMQLCACALVSRRENTVCLCGCVCVSTHTLQSADGSCSVRPLSGNYCVRRINSSCCSPQGGCIVATHEDKEFDFKAYFVGKESILNCK